MVVPESFTILLILLGGAVLAFGGYFLYLYLRDKKEESKENPKLAKEERKEPFPRKRENGRSENRVQNNPPAPEEPVIKIEVKGIEDDERELIELGYQLSNILIDGICHNATTPDGTSLNDFVNKRLSQSSYPFSWDKGIETERRGKIIVIDYQLPSIDDIPDFLEITYKKDHPVVVAPNEKRIKEVWTNISYQIALRSIYELFSSTKFDAIDSIAFNGIIKSLDPATGHITEKCILSMMAERSIFMELDFSRIDPKQCFKRLKGISAHDLASLTPVPPIMMLNKQDKRFVAPDNVLDSIDTGNNLAAMDWKDFENLIRELFEKEFSSNGSEVKITRASKDGGVDAVVFDPDPIRGGKIIIQAKRYTNVVGVSAVRDLYGTVHSEGAIKGILVTTSDYGSDSYRFVKDKPITLLNGANLLHLMGKHGYKASINLAEAKRILKDKDYE